MAQLDRAGRASVSVRTVQALCRARARCAATLPGLALAGAALDGVGIPACIGGGRRAARTVLAAL